MSEEIDHDYWLQRIEDLEKELAQASSSLRLARAAFEDVVGDLAIARKVIDDLRVRVPETDGIASFV